MRHKLSLGTVCAASLLVLVVWSIFGPGSGTAMAQTAEAIREAKSCRFQMKQTVKVEDGPRAGEVQLDAKLYWKAPGSHRMEAQRDNEPIVQINVPNKPGLWINKKSKTYRRLPEQDADKQLPIMRFMQLGRHSGKADRDLGDKKINGVNTRGFEIAMNKLDSKVPNGTMSVWVSKESHLPVLVDYRVSMGPQTIHVTMQDFSWNVELDDKLFDTTPPTDYEDVTIP